MTELVLPQGTFVLQRHPPVRDPSLRAWDAADAYLAAYIAGEEAVGVPPWREPPDGRWVVVDHRAGALAVALHEQAPVLWSDSSVVHEAARRNLRANAVPDERVTMLPSTQTPAAPVAVVLLKVPRTIAMLEDLLARLRPVLAEGAVVLGAAMTKDVHDSTIAAFEAAIGPTVTSHAWRKARLLHATLDVGVQAAPAHSAAPVELAPGVVAVVRPGVFSAERLDGGTGLLLSAVEFADHADAREVLDLGCGSGVLGTAAATALPDAHVTFVDESYAAVASAVETFTLTHPGRACRGEVDDAGTGLEARSTDLVLCNPPFHAQGARGDDVAWRMFGAARRVLAPGGALVVVGNRHLGYHATLARLFRDVEVIGQDRRFVVLRARRPR